MILIKDRHKKDDDKGDETFIKGNMILIKDRHSIALSFLYEQRYGEI